MEKWTKTCSSLHSSVRDGVVLASMPCDPSSPSYGRLTSPTLDLSTVSVLLIDLRWRSREKSIFPLSYLSNTIPAHSRLPLGRKLSRNVNDQLSGNLWSGCPSFP